MSSIDSGSTEVSPRRAFTSTGKKHSTAAITIFDHGLRRPNQAFVIGAKAMIGIALAAIAYGMKALPTRFHRESTSATTSATAQPSAKPATASLNVNQPALQSSPRWCQKVLVTAENRGSRNR